MPIYEYKCENGHTFEVMQRMSDDPVSTCTTCEASVQRVFHPVAVHFKGSGFYNTDYGKKSRGPASSETGPKGESSDGASPSADSAKKSEPKKSEPSSSSSSKSD